jgi:hypothetical protein
LEISKKQVWWVVSGYAGFILILLLLLWLRWISAVSFFVYGVVLPVFIPGMIFMVYYFIHNLKNKKNPVKEGQQMVDSTTVREWAKKFFREKQMDEIEIIDVETMNLGSDGNITPIIYLEIRGVTSHKKYKLLVNAMNPDRAHSLITKDIEYQELLIRAEKLASLPPLREQQKITIIDDLGNVKEIFKDSVTVQKKQTEQGENSWQATQ